MHIFIEPTEPLLFRTGRPFNAGENNFADSIFPPTPETIQGALRTMVAIHWSRVNSDKPRTLDELFQPQSALVQLIGSRATYGCFRITSLSLGRRNLDTENIERLFPAPLHLIQVTFKGASIRCWYLDTANSRVIPLVGEGRDNTIFSITVDQYMAAYNYRLQDGSNLKHHRDRYLKDDWMTFATRLGKNPREASLLKQMISKAAGSPRAVKNVTNSFETSEFLRDLEAIGLVSKLQADERHFHFTLSEEQFKFLDGAWLELYTYQEARRLGLFDDIQWSKEIIDNDPERTARFPLQYKELDISLTYKAQMIVVECKTGKEGLESKTLDEIVTIADLIGRGFVEKLLVSSHSLPDKMDANQQSSQEDFQTKAKRRGVYVVAREKLPLLSDILKKQATTPEYARK
jgi:Domain of unknown function (DUF1887)/CRISPR-associated protein (Cas_Cmr3)